MSAPVALTPGYYAGKDGRVFLGLNELSITKWSGKDSVPFSDRTNSRTGGFQAGTRTIRSMNGSFSCVVTNDAVGDPEFQPGNTYPLVLIAHDGRGYSFPGYVESINPSSETTGDLGFDVEFKSNGTIVPWTNLDLDDTTILSTLLPPITGQGISASGTV
jgi:hypothetical protein